MRKRVFSVLFALIFLLPASTALASLTIDFEVLAGSGSGGGSIEFQNITTGLVGTDIEVDRVSLVPGGPSINLTGGSLNFQTGPIDTYDQTNKIWSFLGNGSLEITGDLVGDGEGSMTLMKGTWKSAKVVASGEDTVDLALVFGYFTDEKNAWLLYKLGLISDPGDTSTFEGPFDGLLHISFAMDPDTFNEEYGYFYSDYILSGDVDNTYVPIPGAVWLLASGVLCLVGVRRKFRK